MHKLRTLLTTVLLGAVVLLTGCTAVVPESSVASVPENVAVLFSSLAEIWLDAGGEIAITVGETVERGLAPEGTQLVDEGAGKTVNLELLISLQPDLVICSADIPAQVEAEALLRTAGIPTLLCRVESFSDYLAALDAMTQITGCREAYEAGAALQSEIDAVLKQSQAFAEKEILFVRAGSTAASTKAKLPEDHFACAMLEEFGCRNIAEAAPVLLDGLSMETILLADPDHIFFSLMGNPDTALAHVQTILEGEAWGQLTAVREGNVTILPRELFHFKPCGRWAEAYAFLADVMTEDTAS